MKSAALIMVALFIDGIQAAFSAGIFIISAFPGTLAGGALGCFAGKAVAGDAGCGIGGFILGLLGSIPLINGLLSTVTVPIGVMLGFAISVCISCTFGAGLITLLFFNRMYYPKYLLPGGVAELIPGFDLIPSWTAMTILCVWQSSKKKVVPAVMESTATSSSITSISDAAQKVATPPRPVDGIRTPTAANDNKAPSLQRYAA